MWHVGCRMCVRAARATAHRSPLDRLKRPPAITTAYALAHVLARRPSVRADVSVSLRYNSAYAPRPAPRACVLCALVRS